MKARLPNTNEQAQGERIRKLSIRNNDRFINYISRLILISAKENVGFGRTRLERFANNAYELEREYMKVYAPYELTNTDFAVDSYYAMRQELLYTGYDSTEETWQTDPYTLKDMGIYGHRSAREREINDQFLLFANRVSFYARHIIVAHALYLHKHEGFGAERIRRVMDPVVEQWKALMRTYLAKDKESCTEEQKRIHQKYNALLPYMADATL